MKLRGVGQHFVVEEGSLLRVPGGRRGRKRHHRRNKRLKRSLLVVLVGPGPRARVHRTLGPGSRLVYVREVQRKGEGRLWLVNPLFLFRASPVEILATAST